jgi:hypothetical protein
MRPAARLVPLPLQPHLRRVAAAVRTRGLTRDDVLVDAFPKSGSTWVRFVLVDLASEGADVDFGNVKDLSAPLGRHRDAPRLIQGRGRLVKSHESYASFGRLPSRALCVIRDGRDVAVSHYHYVRRRETYKGPFDEYLDAFLAGRVTNFGPWHEHVEAWHRAAAARPDDIAVLRYEDLLSPDAPVVLQRVMARIGWQAAVEPIAESLARNNFESMKKKESRSTAQAAAGKRQIDTSVPFVRKGTAGQWRETFSEAQAKEFNAVAGDALAMAGYEA